MRESEKRATVLLLDDEPGIRQSGRRLLEAYGYSCIEAATIEHAVDTLRTTPVAALILDVRLPGKRSGLDLLAEIRLEPTLAEVPVIIMTGGVLSDAEETSISRQRAHLFYKPEGFDTIVKFLDQLTGRDQSH